MKGTMGRTHPFDKLTLSTKVGHLQTHFNFDELLLEKHSWEELSQLISNENFFRLPAGIHPRRQSKKIDRILGYKIGKIEQGLLRKYKAYFKNESEGRKQHYEGTQTWIGLHPQVLQTPYSEILEFFTLLKPHAPKKVVDLGAAYGRVGVVMSSIFPETEFIGYEVVDQRIREARRVLDGLELANCAIENQNILEEGFDLPTADVYFIYDFSDVQDLYKILNQLSLRVFEERFFLVAKGEGIRSIIQLKFPQFWAAHGVIHRKNWSLFSSFCDLN